MEARRTEEIQAPSARQLEPVALGTIAQADDEKGLARLTNGLQDYGPYDLFWPNPRKRWYL